MSMNGITGYNNYSYSNPYAVNNTYANTYSNAGTTAFQGYDPTAMYSTTATAEKEDSGSPLLAIGAGIAAIGTAIYAVKKGKKLNLANLTDDAAKQADNLKGAKGLWNNFTTGVKSIFTKTGREASKALKANGLMDDITKQITEDASKLDTAKVKELIEQQVKLANPEKSGDELQKLIDEAAGKIINKDGKIDTEALQKAIKEYQENNTKSIKAFFTKSEDLSTANVEKKAEASVANTVQIKAEDKILKDKYGSNMSEIAYFHSL